MDAALGWRATADIKRAVGSRKAGHTVRVHETLGRYQSSFLKLDEVIPAGVRIQDRRLVVSAHGGPNQASTRTTGWFCRSVWLMRVNGQGLDGALSQSSLGRSPSSPKTRCYVSLRGNPTRGRAQQLARSHAVTRDRLDNICELVGAHKEIA